jgi:hypothetical protein
LTALENKVGVRLQVLALIDKGAFGELPAGLYGRHAIRAYATAVGLDANQVLEKVRPSLPEPEDPLDGLARVRGLGRRSKARPPVNELPAAPRTPVAKSPNEPDVDAGVDWRSLAASAIDSALLVSVVVGMAQLTALAAGAPLSHVVAVAAPAWGLMAAVIACLYFVLLAGVRNATLGARLVEAPMQDEAKGMDAGTAIRRGLRCALRESSILVDWLVTSRPKYSRLRVLSQRS